MGLGFPDQTIIWDAAATSSNTRALLEERSSALPFSIRELAISFYSSLVLETIGSEQTLQSKPEFLEIDNAALQPLW